MEEEKVGRAGPMGEGGKLPGATFNPLPIFLFLLSFYYCFILSCNQLVVVYCETSFINFVTLYNDATNSLGLKQNHLAFIYLVKDLNGVALALSLFIRNY